MTCAGPTREDFITLDLLIKLARVLKVELVAIFNYAWWTLSEAELLKQIRAMADQADLETLRDMLALMKARGL